MRTWRWYSKLLFALLVAAFAYLVWPTPWRYLSWHEMPIKVHRLTGRTEMLRAEGWREVKASPASGLDPELSALVSETRARQRNERGPARAR